MSSLFYRKPRLLILAIALIVVAGLSALEVLPRYEDPELVSRNAIVITPYAGADADRVESQVTEKIETELEEIGEISLLESVSRAGVSIVSIELYDSITETDAIWSRVRDRLDDAALEFPAGAGEPDFDEADITAWSMHVALTWELEGEPSHAVLGRLAEDLEDALRAVSGTQETEIFGAPAEEIAVHVDPARLAAMGLTAEGLAAALARGDSKVPAGRLDTGSGEMLLEVAGELDGLARIARVPVLEGADGALVRLGEIATIERTVEDPPAELAVMDGRAAVLVAVRMRSGERIDRWAARAHQALAAFESRVPGGIAMQVVYDQSAYTDERLDDLFANLGIGALLVILVILFAMGWRSALLVGSALPLSALMVLAGMRALGIPMHQMSVTGLIIALGLLIDNAIVMVDEVNHELDKEQTIAAAVSRAVGGLAIPLLASTLTTVLAFMPLVLAEGGVGEFVGSMSMAVVLAVTSSFFLALTVIPALTGLIRRVGSNGEELNGTRTSSAAVSLAGQAEPASMQRGAARRGGRVPLFLESGLSSARLTALYRRVLGVLYAQPVLAIAVAVALPLFGFWKGMSLQEQFFPPAGRDQAAVELVLSDLASLERTRTEVDAADAILRAHPSVTATHWVLGRSAPKFYYNQLESVEGQASFAGGHIQLDTNKGAEDVIRELQTRLDLALPGAQVLVRQLEQGPPFDAPIELILQGPDLDVLHERGEVLRELLARVPDVLHTRAGIQSGRPKLLFTPADEELERAGLDRVGVAERLQAALSGALGGTLLEGSEELPVRVRLARAERDDATSVGALALASPEAGGWLPLDALGELELVPETARIARRNGRRTNEVQAFIRAGELPQDSLEAVTALLADFDLPAGYELSFGGEAAERDDAMGSLAASAGILIVLMISVLVLSFQSFGLAAVVGGVAMLSVGLSMGALWTFGHPFGFMAIVGTMGLMGIAINDSIVVLAALRNDPRARTGDPRAIVEVVVRSTRHVLSTTVTTVAGFTPLLMQSEGLWPPLAVSIAGGVGGATLLALTFVPGAYALLTRKRVTLAVPASAQIESSALGAA